MEEILQKVDSAVVSELWRVVSTSLAHTRVHIPYVLSKNWQKLLSAAAQEHPDPPATQPLEATGTALRVRGRSPHQDRKGTLQATTHASKRNTVQTGA